MSDTLLATNGVSAETTALALQIKAVQQPEIDTVNGWLTAWGKSADGARAGWTTTRAAGWPPTLSSSSSTRPRAWTPRSCTWRW